MNNLFLAIIVVILLAVLAWWYYTYRYNTFFVQATSSGSTVTVSCGGDPITIISAKYNDTDVTQALQKIIDSNYVPGTKSITYNVDATNFGIEYKPDDVGLSFRYKCSTSEKKSFCPNKETHNLLMNHVRIRENLHRNGHAGNSGGNSDSYHELGALIMPANEFCYC